MISRAVVVLLLFSAGMTSGCSGGGTGPGYWFQLIFIVVPIGFLGYLIVKRFDALSDALFNIESKLDKISDDKAKEPDGKPAPKGRTKK